MLDAIFQVLGALGLAAEIATAEPEPAAPDISGGASAASAYQAPITAQNQQGGAGGPQPSANRSEPIIFPAPRADWPGNGHDGLGHGGQELPALNLERAPELAR
jgi:hypothetical protein